MRHRKKKAAERKEKQFQESLERIIEALPVTVFEVNPMTKDMKCHICFGKFQPNDVMRTLPCHHSKLFIKFFLNYILTLSQEENIFYRISSKVHCWKSGERKYAL